ncbi:uncharacterized protein LOC129219197 [Uloborus diversus]|uniref:uncharacterized protein LOC129219197 n=1 Tax=Uloborus diversus TaxID=327109 RepID=UPI0024093D63|nr:uncharacterized protein LOC129219197 [Uloborus diversus]
MKIIRFQLKRFLVVCVLGCLIIIAQLFWRKQSISNCLLPPEVLGKYEDFLHFIQKPLISLNITYFLCYNTLWGVLKFKGPLPWHDSVELCTLNTEILPVHDTLYSVFEKYKIYISYNPAGGFYTMLPHGENFPSGTLTIFIKDPITGQLIRNGWIHRMFPPTSCEKLHCFPPNLIKKPLPIVKFGRYTVPSPREGIEIQKYLYPSSWWQEITPPNCRD